MELGLRMPPVSTIHNIIYNCDSHRNYSAAVLGGSVGAGAWSRHGVLSRVEVDPKFDSDSPGTDCSEQSGYSNMPEFHDREMNGY